MSLYKKRVRGFTLIEMVMVIVIMGIMALVSVRFVGHSAQGMVDISDRQRLAGTAAIAAEKILREVRSALPNSVRTFSDGTNECLEIVPILASSEYISVPIGSAATSFTAIKLQNSAGGEEGLVAVYGSSTASIYTQSTPGPISILKAVASAPTAGHLQTFTFDGGGTYQFSSDSPTKRFYLVSEPIAFCNDGAGRLWRYDSYGFQPTAGDGIPTVNPNRRLLADSLEVNSLEFEHSPVQLQRNAIVRISMILLRSGTNEKIEFTQEVQLRNVP